MTVRTLLQITLVNVSAVVTYGIGNVEREVVATLLGGNLQQVQVLLLRQVLIKVHVQGRAAREVLDVGSAVQLELVDDAQRVVLRYCLLYFSIRPRMPCTNFL